MANTKSAKKNIRVTKRKTKVNKARKSRIKTFFNKVMDAIKGKDPKKAREAFVKFESELMKGVSKKVYKKNTAARKLRRTAKQIKTIKKAPATKKPATKTKKKATKKKTTKK